MYVGIDSYGGIRGAGGLVCLRVVFQQHCWTCWTSNPSPSSQASLYFVLLVVLGNFVVINVFLAIAVESLEAMREVVDELNEIEARDNEAHEERPDPVVGSFLAPPHKHPFPFSKRAKSYDN